LKTNLSGRVKEKMENKVIFHNPSSELQVEAESRTYISNAPTDDVLFELDSHLCAHVWELKVHYDDLIPKPYVTKTTD
jgi:hypothetical protein